MQTLRLQESRSIVWPRDIVLSTLFTSWFSKISFVEGAQQCHRICSLLKFGAVIPAVCSGLLRDTENISCNWLAIDCFYNCAFLYTCPPPKSLPYSQDRDTNSVVTDYYITSESLIKSLQTQLSFVSIKPWKVTWVTKKFQACLPNKQQYHD